MGCIETKEERRARTSSKTLDRLLQDDGSQYFRDIKLLLLGAGESGKSTLLKQMKIIHQHGYSVQDLYHYRPVIYSNIIQSFIAVIRAMPKLLISFDLPTSADDSRLLIKIVEEMKENQPFYRPTVAAMKRLLADPGMTRCLKRCSEFQINDSAQYFFANLDRISQHNYLPTEQDILRTRVKTTGIVEVNFTLKNMNFRLFDVGGQRSERRKWIHCFDDVTAVLFCSSLSEYDQVLYEDETTNRMHESLRLPYGFALREYLAQMHLH